MTAQEILNIIGSVSYTPPVDINIISTALSKVDQATIQSQEQAKFKYIIWDKISPIDVTPASQVIALSAMGANDQAYIIQDPTTGKLIYFQPFDPLTMTRMDSTTVDNSAQNHINSLATQNANGIILQQTLVNLTKMGYTPTPITKS